MNETRTDYDPEIDFGPSRWDIFAIAEDRLFDLKEERESLLLEACRCADRRRYEDWLSDDFVWEFDIEIERCKEAIATVTLD